jgi:hypothetical protein
MKVSFSRIYRPTTKPKQIIRQVRLRRIKWAGHVARKGERKVYTDLAGKNEVKRPLGRPRRREGGIRMILGRLAGGVEWIQLAQDRDRWRVLVNTVMNLRVLAPRS